MFLLPRLSCYKVKLGVRSDKDWSFTYRRFGIGIVKGIRMLSSSRFKDRFDLRMPHSDRFF